MMHIPDIHEAESLLQWAVQQNPGPWEQHSKHAARAAAAIAEACGMDADMAYTLAMLHDIGRYEGVRGLHHVIAGYELMNQMGYTVAARICLSHSFPVRDIATYNGSLDCSQDEMQTLQNALETIIYDDYDLLIQLCDAMATANGIVPVEFRLVDVAIRNGVGERYQEKWKSFLAIKAYFDRKCGHNVYALFADEIKKNIF